VKLLAIDTSSNACSVALAAEDRVYDKHEISPREHTRILLPMISGVLASAGTALHDLDAIVLGNGPGSFIGMRIGASVAQGLAFGADLAIVPVSSLAAVAAEVFASGSAARVLVAQDAHMRQVYCGCFERGDDGLPALLGEERIVACDSRLELSAPAVAAGAGWEHYPELLAGNRPVIDFLAGVLHPRARYLLPLGAARLERGLAVAPAQLVPAYLRSKVAEKPS